MGRSAKQAKAAKQSKAAGSKKPSKEDLVAEVTDSVSGLSVNGGGSDVYQSTPAVNAAIMGEQKPSAEEVLSNHIARTTTGVLASIPSSRDVKIEQFSLQFYGQKLIDNTTIELTMGRRYGLLGANGSGKSTFLKSLAAREAPIPEHIDIFLLNEEFAKTELSALEAVIEEAKKEVKRLDEQLEYLMETEGPECPLLDDIYERMETLDPDTFETRASSILHGLGFDSKTVHKKTKDMSGGWRMRVSLAKALFVKPTLLLLDGMFNHLYDYYL